MAHLPQDQLPSEFDVVVDGTGLVQSVLAAALARAGKTVLHLDCNAYYGELWGSLMHREMQEWMTEYRSCDEETTPPTSEPSDTQPAYLPCEGECVLEIDRTHIPASITNLVETVHTVPEDDNSSTHGRAEYGGNVKSEGEGDGGATSEGNIGDGATGEGDIGDGATGEGDIGDGATGEGDTGDGATGEGDIGDGATGEGDTGVGATGEGDIGDGATGEGDTGDGATSEGTEAGNGKDTTEPSATTPLSSKVTWQSLEPQWRRFNFDLLPKFIFCRGATVDLITESSCSRYIEFRAVGGIFNYNNGQIEQVPCSRSDVFSSKAVTMMEKRKMMKFLTFCADFQQHPEEYKDVATLPYVEYLRQRQLTPNLVQYILHSIAMVTDTTTTLEGLQATQVFINSLGRYGNAPFLFPIFGGGELPQAFCRLCAVYGGVYCLHRHVTSIISSAPDNTISSIVCSSGQKIKCSSVVLSAAYLTKTVEFKGALKTTRLSRAMLVTDSPLEGTDGKLSLTTLPPGSLGEAQTVAIRVIQLDHLSNSCPAGTCESWSRCSVPV